MRSGGRVNTDYMKVPILLPYLLILCKLNNSTFVKSQLSYDLIHLCSPYQEGKSIFLGNREIKCTKNLFFHKKLNWNDDFGFQGKHNLKFKSFPLNNALIIVSVHNFCIIFSLDREIKMQLNPYFYSNSRN